MRVYNALTQTLLLGNVIAQLLFPKIAAPQPAADDHPLLLGTSISRSQNPLGNSPKTSNEPPIKSGQFTKKQQDNRICPSYGESQWTGMVNVGEGRDIFYWFFDSRNNPKTDPIILWMNGGPGASSMIGLFTEMGPCWLEVGSDQAKPNPWSWNKNASLLFIDQPAGAGLSNLAEDQPVPSREQDTAIDFQKFLNIFFTDVFPDRRNLPIHITTESYGGHYGPVYLHHILQSRRYDSKLAFWGNIESLILIDAVIDWTGTFVGVYKLLCENRERVGLLNATACESIARNLPEQQRLGRSCQLAYVGEECRAAYNRGVDVIHASYINQGKAGMGHPGNIRKKCAVGAEYPLCVDSSMANITGYLNQEWVKKALEKPSTYEFSNINKDIWTAFSSSGAFLGPTTKELIDVLDAYTNKDKVADVRVLVINGNLDYIANTPGNMWQYDRLEWSGQAEYSIKEWRPLPDGLAATGLWKATSNGRLALVAVDEAGHFLPGDVREGSYRIVQEWLRGGWRM